MQNNSKPRLYYLDNIKVFLTMLLVTHHVGQAYGPTGGFWQYKNSLGENIPFLGRYFGVNAAFFMGFFFLISGYFMPMSFDRSNGRGFLKKRFIKYGIPMVFAVLIINPIEMYFHYMLYSGNKELSFFKYYTDIYFGLKGMPQGFITTLVFPELNFGHMWYVEHLLIYAIIYFIIRKAVKWHIKQEDRNISFLILCLIAIIISIITYFVRIFYPIDKWIGLLGFIQVEVAHLPQYMIMLITGIIAYRKNWFENFKKKTGYLVLGIAFIIVIMAYAGLYVWNIWPISESFLAVFLCFGLITLFKEKFNKTSSFMRDLSNSSYAAYVFHFPIVLFIQYSFDKISIGGAWGKFIIVSILSILVTYSICHFLLKIKFIKNILAS